MARTSSMTILPFVYRCCGSLLGNAMSGKRTEACRDFIGGGA
jgi:hypothetical protein